MLTFSAVELAKAIPVRLVGKGNPMTLAATHILPTPDQFLLSAAGYLIEGRENEAAGLLLTCSIESLNVEEGDFGREYLEVVVRRPRVAYDALQTRWGDGPGKLIQQACEAVAPLGCESVNLRVRASLVDADPTLRAELIDRARGRSIDNQAATARQFLLWENLRFRSLPEIKVAEALDRRRVMFFPLCMARVNLGPRRTNREPDFRVCHNGKWGMIEIDGRKFHQGLSAEDHEQDRLFRSHGDKVVERFQARRSHDVPDEVVDKFLTILDRNG
jgi:hypothetical protein